MMTSHVVSNRARAPKAPVKLLTRGIAVYPILAIIALWEYVARAEYVPNALLPAFSVVIKRGWELLFNGELITAAGVTMMRASLGLLIAAAVGIVVGLVMSRVALAKWFFNPIISFGFSTPTITLLPIFMLWFGTGSESKIMLVALSCFFPIALSTYDGARNVPKIYLWSAQAMGTKGHALFRRVILPGSVSFIFAGIRIAVPLAVIIAVLTEMVAGGGGLGYMLMYGYRFLDTSTSFASLLAVLLLGLAIDKSLLFARKRLLPWESGSDLEI